MSTVSGAELEELLEILRRRGYSPIGVIFYDDKLKLLGLAPMSGVPDAFVETVGRRLGNVAGWQGVADS